MTQAYITGVGAYPPGEPVDNEQLLARLGDGSERTAAVGKRVLAANGIRTRYYAVDIDGMTSMLNEELAAQAVRRALATVICRPPLSNCSPPAPHRVIC